VSGGLFPKGEWNDWIDGHGTPKGEPVDAHVNELYPEDGTFNVSALYKNMAKAIDADLRKAPEAVLHTEATPRGGKVVAKVRVGFPSSSHSDVYVRMLVVEDVVNTLVTDAKPVGFWSQIDGIRQNHYMVVRSASRDGKSPDRYPLGSLLHGAGAVEYTFDMAKVQRQLLASRDVALKLAKSGAGQNRQNGPRRLVAAFTGKDNWVMDPARLYLVALAQDVHTGDVLQAQMVHVDTGPKGERLKLP